MYTSNGVTNFNGIAIKHILKSFLKFISNGQQIEEMPKDERTCVCRLR